MKKCFAETRKNVSLLKQNKLLYMKLLKPFIVFDLETTGTSISDDKIVQLAVIKKHPDGKVEKKTMLLNPGISIPKEATEVHGITDEMVKDKPFFKQIAKSLFEFFFGCDLGGYNSDQFDIPLLMAEFDRCDIHFLSWTPNVVDGLKIERMVNSHKLEYTYARHTGKTLDNAHDAMADSEATLEVLESQFEMLMSSYKDEKGNIIPLTIEQVDTHCQQENERFDYAGKAYKKEGSVFWSFGKNKDRDVLQDRSYLDWVLKSNFPIDTKNKLIKLITNNK